ncbi:MAG TPA: hypothetical protein DCP32_12425 [Anaerolineaceae bacterium]|nr:MAG: hypothetical protein A2X24_07615 [Chloroflexi bacterium GWB2_54_36]HAL17510.1 hypothetical protein [Anaerolineaceae bacterium]
MMERETTDNHSKNSRPGVLYLIGIVMVAVGILVLADQYLKTGWLLLAFAPIFGIFFLVEALRMQRFTFLVIGGLLLGAGLGGFVGMSSLFNRSLAHDIGWLLVFFATGWVAIAYLSRKILVKPAWWALVPAGIIFSTGIAFLLSDLRVIDFVLWVVSGTGIVLLVWGVYWRLFGLIIPGSLMVTTGPGIYLAWGSSMGLNPLAKTGIMLAIFAIGWALIILFSRVVTSKFVWWPLIPTGILAMVGWGLYIGGDPKNATSFIANTGSIGLIIFGIYLLLLRKGIHR